MLKRMNERVVIFRGVVCSITVLMLGALAVQDANAQQVEWMKTYGRRGTGCEDGREVIRTSDGGYVIAGSTSSGISSGDYDVYLIKTDANGNVVWEKTFGGTDWDEGYSVQETSDGGYIVAGNTRSFGEGYYSSVYLIRTDENGDSIWTRAYGGSFSTYGYSVRQTSDGGYIIGGDSFGSAYYAYLIKTDVDGNVTWSRSYGSDTMDVHCYSVCQTSDGGYVLAGYTDYVSGCIGFNHVYLARTDPGGDTLWTRTFDDTTFFGSYNDWGYSVQQTSDGGYMIAGYTTGGSGTQALLVKTDDNGDMIYTRAIGVSDYTFAYSVQQTLDGGYVIAGRADCDACLIRTDENGDSIWTRTYEGLPPSNGYSVCQTPDGGYIIVGDTYSSGPSKRDMYLIKTFANGDTVWTRTHGYAGGNDYGYSVCQTSEGGYIVVGQTFSYGAGRSDVYLVKTDDEGDTLWVRSYGGKEDDEGHSIQQTSDGGYIVAGYTKSFGEHYSSVYLIRTDENGDSIWTRTYGTRYYNEGHSVQQTSDGGYIVGGHTKSLGYQNDIYLIKTDSEGDTAWTRTCYSTMNVCARSYSVRQTLDGGYIVVSSTDSSSAGETDMYLVKMDTNGSTVWRKTYGGTSWDFGHSVQQTSDSGYIVVGSTSSFGVAHSDVYLVKTDLNGDTAWTKTYGTGTDWDRGYSVQQTLDGGYIVAGYTSGLSSDDVYLIKTDANGDTIWTGSYGGAGYDIGRSVIQTSNGGYVIAGWTNSYGPRGYDVLLMRVSGQGVEEGSNDQLATGNGQLSVLPNPFIHSTIIEYLVPVKANISLEIYDITGRTVTTLVNEQKEPGIHKATWSAEGLATGVYFAKLRVGDHESCQKLILLK